MEQPLVFLEIFVRGKTKHGNRAVREVAIKRPIVTIDMLVTAFGVLETFVEVETCDSGAFEYLVTIEGGEVVILSGM